MSKIRKNTFVNLLAGAVLMAASMMLVPPQPVQASNLAQVMVRFDRLQTSTATTGTVCAESVTTDTEAAVVVAFPTGYTVNAAPNWTVSTTNLAWPAGASAWPGINTATDVSGQEVTFPSDNLTPGTLYCFNWNDEDALTTASGASADNQGTLTLLDGSDDPIDSGTYATATISDDQVLVTATVAATFSFTLSANEDDLGELDLGDVTSSPTPRTATVSTNAHNGWQVWARDSNTGLFSATASHTIASTTPGTNSTLSPGSEGYNTGVSFVSQSDGSGTVTIAPAFVGAASGQGGGLDTQLRTIATSDGTADTSVISLTNNATISSITPAGADYTDLITLVAAGLF